MSASLVSLYKTMGFSSGRPDIQIDHDLTPTLQKIRKQVSEQLSWKNSGLSVAKNLVDVKTLPKIVFCMGIGYIEYILIKGTFAGIEVDTDSNFTNLFSTDRETRLATGLDLTNGNQAGQFIFDGAALSFITFNLVFREPYYKFAAEAINTIYEPFLAELLHQMETIKIQIDSSPKDKQLLQKLVVCQENVNRLYKRLEKDLKPYRAEPRNLLQEVTIDRP